MTHFHFPLSYEGYEVANLERLQTFYSAFLLMKITIGIV